MGKLTRYPDYFSPRIGRSYPDCTAYLEFSKIYPDYREPVCKKIGKNTEKVDQRLISRRRQKFGWAGYDLQGSLCLRLVHALKCNSWQHILSK